MSRIKCAEYSCGKEFERPVIVKNSVYSPKETYYACPFCLTKIEFFYDHSLCEEFGVIGSSTIANQEKMEKPEQSNFVVELLDEYETKLSSFEEIEHLEQIKNNSFLDLEILRKVAITKVEDLQMEIKKLKREVDTLRKIMNEQN
jgi:hypothetical protein